MSRKPHALAVGLLAVFALSPSVPAFAHHAMGDVVPQTFATGFISGLAHPVIGPDHLAFILALGALAGLSRMHAVVSPILFAVATVAGTGVAVTSSGLISMEWIVAGSVVLAGVLLISNWRVPILGAAGIALLAGLAHGSAYGASMIGAETAPLTAYLCGFLLIQLCLMAVTAFGVRWLLTLPAFAGGGAWLQGYGAITALIGLLYFA